MDGVAVKDYDDVINNMRSGIFNTDIITLTGSTENDFLASAMAQLKTESNSNATATRYGTIIKMISWSGYDHYIFFGYRVTAKWMYTLVYSFDRLLIVTYNCDTNAIDNIKRATLTT